MHGGGSFGMPGDRLALRYAGVRRISERSSVTFRRISLAAFTRSRRILRFAGTQSPRACGRESLPRGSPADGVELGLVPVQRHAVSAALFGTIKGSVCKS